LDTTEQTVTITKAEHNRLLECKEQLELAESLLEEAHSYMDDTHGYNSDIFAEITTFLYGEDED